MHSYLTEEYHRVRVALDTLHLIPRKSQSPHQGLQSPTWSDSLSLAFSSPSSLPLASQTRPTSLLLFSQYAKWVPSLGFLYCPFPPLGHSTYRHPLINCLTSFKTLLTCHFLNKTYADHPTKNCNSPPPHAHTFLIPVILPYFCTGYCSVHNVCWTNKWRCGGLEDSDQNGTRTAGPARFSNLTPKGESMIGRMTCHPRKIQSPLCSGCFSLCVVGQTLSFQQIPTPSWGYQCFWSSFFFFFF